MLNSKMETALNQQINAELWSGYFYLSMSCDMDSKGYEGMASWFALQAKEEFEHAKSFMNHIGKMGGKVTLLPVGEVRQEWNTPTDAFEDTLMHEKTVTEKIYRLMDLAIELKDYATQGMLKLFVDEQVEEENTVRKILDTLKKIECYSSSLYAFDKKLGKRGISEN